MTMVCDRCGEAFDFEFNTKRGNAIQEALFNERDKPILTEMGTVVLCPSCMAKLNDRLKGEQK